MSCFLGSSKIKAVSELYFYKSTSLRANENLAPFPFAVLYMAPRQLAEDGHDISGWLMHGKAAGAWLITWAGQKLSTESVPVIQPTTPPGINHGGEGGMCAAAVDWQPELASQVLHNSGLVSGKPQKPCPWSPGMWSQLWVRTTVLPASWGDRQRYQGEGFTSSGFQLDEFSHTTILIHMKTSLRTSELGSL